MNKRINAEMWKERIEEYRKSNLSAKKWCEANDVKISTLKWWIGRLNKDKSKVEEVPEKQEWICLSGNSEARENDELKPIIIKISKLSIEIPEKINEQMLTNILKVFGTVSD